ncbi:uncharacterized protein [Excalfactoria chinensis]|uniref:uncharacterized protein isoform X4 n=1 Tax=Excalfactoria chinensis TaxID=46218 RepID=UPI003B3A30D5
MPARVCISTARRRNLRVSPEAESRPARPWAPLRPHRASFVPPHRGVSAAGRVPSAWAGGGGSQACIRTCIHTYTRVQAAAIGTHTSPAVSPPPAPRHLPTPSRTSRTAASGPPRKGQRGAVLTPLISSRPPRSSAHPICRPHALKRGVSTQTARRWSPGGSEGAGGALPAGGHAALSVAAFKQRRQSTGNDFQGKTRCLGDFCEWSDLQCTERPAVGWMLLAPNAVNAPSSLMLFSGGSRWTMGCAVGNQWLEGKVGNKL